MSIFTTNEASLPSSFSDSASETLVAHTHFLIFIQCFSEASVSCQFIDQRTTFPNSISPNTWWLQTKLPPELLSHKPHLHPLNLPQKNWVQNLSLRGQHGLWVKHHTYSVSPFLSFPHSNCTSLRNQDVFPIITVCYWHLLGWPAPRPTGAAWELWLQGRVVIDFLNLQPWRLRSGMKGPPCLALYEHLHILIRMVPAGKKASGKNWGELFLSPVCLPVSHLLWVEFRSPL